MKNLIIITVIVVFALGISTYIFSNRASETVKDQTPIRNDESIMEIKPSNSIGYVEYSKANLDAAASGRRVLFFYASWCPTCRPADTSFNENKSKIPSDLTIIRVNYNDSDTNQEEKDLAKKYNITYQHTYVQIDGQGNAITLWNGGQINELLSNIK